MTQTLGPYSFLRASEQNADCNLTFFMHKIFNAQAIGEFLQGQIITDLCKMTDLSRFISFFFANSQGSRGWKGKTKVPIRRRTHINKLCAWWKKHDPNLGSNKFCSIWFHWLVHRGPMAFVRDLYALLRRPVFALVNNGRTQHTQLCLADCTTVCTSHQVRKKRLCVMTRCFNKETNFIRVTHCIHLTHWKDEEKGRAAIAGLVKGKSKAP